MAIDKCRLNRTRGDEATLLPFTSEIIRLFVVLLASAEHRRKNKYKVSVITSNSVQSQHAEARELAIDIPRHFQRNPQMMKIPIAVIATILSLATAVGCFAASPQMGTWKLNEAKSKIPAGMGKNNTVTYVDQKDKIKITVDGTDKNGKPTHSVWMGKFDGKAYPVKGNLSYNAVAYRTVNDRTNDITALKDGKVMWSGRITVAPDGKSRTVTINGTDANGKKFSGKAVYNKG